MGQFTCRASWNCVCRRRRRRRRHKRNLGAAIKEIKYRLEKRRQEGKWIFRANLSAECYLRVDRVGNDPTMDVAQVCPTAAAESPPSPGARMPRIFLLAVLVRFWPRRPRCLYDRRKEDERKQEEDRQSSRWLWCQVVHSFILSDVTSSIRYPLAVLDYNCALSSRHIFLATVSTPIWSKGEPIPSAFYSSVSLSFFRFSPIIAFLCCWDLKSINAPSNLVQSKKERKKEGNDIWHFRLLVPRRNRWKIFF